MGSTPKLPGNELPHPKNKPVKWVIIPRMCVCFCSHQKSTAATTNSCGNGGLVACLLDCAIGVEDNFYFFLSDVLVTRGDGVENVALRWIDSRSLVC